MEKIRLYEILDTLSRNEKLQVLKEEYSELIDLLAQDNSPLIEAWIEMRRKTSEFFEEPNREVLDDVLANLRRAIGEEAFAGREGVATEPELKAVREAELVDRVQMHTIQGRNATENNRFRVFVKRFQQVAAVLVIPLMAGLVYLTVSDLTEKKESPVAESFVALPAFNTVSTQEYYSPAGTRSKVVLKDSTVVFLNSATTLLVDNEFGDSLRRVKLSGEAYFDVRHDTRRPFIVDAGEKLRIKVTGTQFTVNAYPDKENVETVLLSGSVELAAGKQVVTLNPMQRAVFDNDRKIVIASGVKTEKYEKWKDGMLVFDNTPMAEIKNILEKWYNVEISIQDEQVMHYTFSGKLNNCSLQQVLEYISLSSQMKFTINKDKVAIYKIE